MQNQATYYTKLSVKNYYPFGMTMPGRHKPAQSGEEYRFGFNGKEKDPEGMGGGGSTYDYGFRIYNPQLGKFLSIDPLASNFAWNSSYAYAGNDVIRCIDLDVT
ncbi:MAG: RHS repeat-associated core domain-containing protein [Chitinophagales bacterium]